MTADVHQALLAFLEADDFDVGKEVVQRLSGVLLSDEGMAYLDKQVKHAGGNPELAAVLELKGRALRDSRRMSIGFAFAQMFLELQPAEVSEEVATLLAALTPETDVQTILDEHPEYLPQIQRVTKGTVLQNELQEELMGPTYPKGDPRRVEACRLLLELCDRRIDPETWASLAGELGNALSAAPDSQTALEEAVTIYHDLLTMPQVTASTALLASTEQNLGSALAALSGPDEPELLREAVTRLERALDLHESQRDGLSVAQGSLSLARPLLEWQGENRSARLDQAVRAALHAARLFEQAGNETAWMAAQDTLEVAYGVRWLESGRPSEHRLLPDFEDETWELVERNEANSYRAEEWVPGHEPFELWTELVTVERYSGAEDMPFPGFLRSRQNKIAARLTNGLLDFGVVSETPAECVYQWSVTDDFGIEDQSAVVRLVRGQDALHALHYTSRGAYDPDHMASWRDRLDRSPLSEGEVQTPQGSEPATKETIDERLGILASPPRETISTPGAFCAAMMTGIPRATMPDLHRAMLSLCGMHLYRDRLASPGTLTAAASVLRRSLEIPQERDEIWARTASSLGKVWLRSQQSSSNPNLQPALEAFQQAAEVFTRLEMPNELGATYDGVARVAERLAGEPQTLARAIGLFVHSLELRARETDPEGWASTTLGLGEACLRLYQETGDEASLAQAEEAYQQVVDALAGDPLFADLSGEDSAGLLMGAISGLNAIDRDGIPEPRVPPGFEGRETEGTVLYLRPLLSAGTLKLQNRFEDLSLFSVQFDVEPGELTLESVVYRALAERMSFRSIGGRTEGLGSTRMFIVGGEGWRDIALLEMEGADIILMVPHDSPGVRWELDTIRAKSWLAKTVFLMPPESAAYDVASLWRGATVMMRAVGLHTPAWHADGLFIRFDEEGSVRKTISFGAVWRNEIHDLLTDDSA